ncbi:heterokaryon incompatibility protein-domain-containing protein [Xylaria cubensis]|nr:heterokaryon incompatibility protein-domain-containing protein [Xylaria cubensis]
MASLSILCRVCHDALYTGRCSLEKPQDVYVYQSHHPTLDSFRSAVTQKCLVCRIVYDNVNHQEQNLLTEARIETASTMYRIRSKGDLQDLQVVVIFLGRRTRVETKFQLLPTSDPTSIRFFPHLQLDADTSSSTTLDLALHWYQSCCSSHPLCSRQSQRCPGWLPRRLLDIGSQGETCWRLVVASQDGIAPAPYATLSYRWGIPDRSLRLLRSTLDDFRGGQQRISDLPRTFQDAIVVAWRLSIRYLWIDALCIVQDVHEDKAREIPQMRSIYSNAACNLAASASSDPYGGLFRARDTTAVAPGLVAAPSGALRDETHHVVDMSYRDRQILDGPLHKRGWVFQERFLSTRVLYFGQSQIFWECLSELKCEGFPHGMPQSFRSAKNLESLWEMGDARRPSSPQNGPANDLPEDQAMSTPALRLWNSLVREYSNCALTLPDDRLSAFSGVAELFREITGDQYLAGLWRSNLLHLLDWWVDQPRSRSSEKYRAPSWSWASVDGPIRPRFAVAQSAFLVSVSAVETPPDSSTTPGNVCLRLVGSLSLLTQHKQPMHCALRPDALGITLGVPGPFYFLSLQTIRYEALPRSLGQCATEVSCLLLEPVLCTVPVVYRRVGHCTVADADDISRLGLQVDESGLASSQGGPDSMEIAII